jgi:phosphoserine phosphatase
MKKPTFDIICFDCDSTLSRIEGIDECAKNVGLGAEMATLTHAAMNGERALETIYQKRLELIRPNQASIQVLADLYINEIVDDVKEVFDTLHQHQKHIHIISGGLRQAILPLATLLNLPPSQVHAVDIFFDEKGHYKGYDQTSPLAKTGGKALICQKINPHSEKMVLIGDGKTDLEAQQVGVTVIGFGGVARREFVEKNADFYVSEPSLTPILKYIL